MNDHHRDAAWDYRHGIARAFRLTESLPGLGTEERAQLVRDLREGGGKAFGNRIGTHVFAGSHTIAVPPFITVRREARDDVMLPDGDRVFVRSSGPREDWACPGAGSAAGGGRSALVPVAALDAHLTARFDAGESAVVIQRYVEGAGIVIDTGYSTLLDTRVIRVQAGRARYNQFGEPLDVFRNPRLEAVFGKGRFTSPTYDADTSVWLFNADGVLLYEQRSSVALDMLQRGIAPWMFNAEVFGPFLSMMLQCSGILFDTQCELVAHPSMGTPVQLVQLRPRPQYGTMPRRSRFVRGKPIAITPRTSPMPYNVVGPLVLRKGDPYLARTGEHEPGQRHWRSAIVLWEDAARAQYVPRHPVAINTVTEGGAVGQITCGPIATDVLHEFTVVPEERIAAWRRAQMTPQLGVTWEVYQRLLALAAQGGQVVRIASDGLVGSVSLVS